MIDTKELRRLPEEDGKNNIDLGEIHELINRLEAAEKERDILRASLALESQENGALRDSVDRACEERDELQAKITEMENMKPVGVLHVGSYYGEELQDWEFEANQCACDKLNEAYVRNPMSLPLYALPGAKAQNATSIPEGWLRAIDEALVVAHVGVANESDTYEQAKAKLNNLIGFHVDVATDPAVNGGWKLVPMVSTYEMEMAGSDHCDGYMSTAQAVWDAMLAVAPNERSEYQEAKL